MGARHQFVVAGSLARLESNPRNFHVMRESRAVSVCFSWTGRYFVTKAVNDVFVRFAYKRASVHTSIPSQLGFRVELGS